MDPPWCLTLTDTYDYIQLWHILKLLLVSMSCLCPCFIARKQPNMSESILHLQINFGPSRSGTKHTLSLWYKDRVYITLFWYKDFENYVSMANKYYVNICMFVFTYLNLSSDINWDCLVNFWKQLMNMTIFNLFSSVF